MLDQRSLAEKSADLEVEQVQLELHDWGLELEGEGLGETEILSCFRENLEERLARLYRELYEIGEG